MSKMDEKLTHSKSEVNATQESMAGGMDANAPSTSPGVIEAVQNTKDFPNTDDSKIGEKSDVVKGMEKFIISDEGEEDLIEEKELEPDTDKVNHICKPNRSEFFKLNPVSSIAVHMLYYKPNHEAIGESILYVVDELRGNIAQELQLVRFYLCRSCYSRRYFLWPVKISNNSWSDSLKFRLFSRPTEFFLNNAFRVKADMELRRYRILSRPDIEVVNWPTKSIAELLTDALGPSNIISSPEHPVYRELISGEEL